ncbi:hypothetical protein HDU85_005301 [Gaertneriomyces sp. JEL0708]|nr:hypothetical protein HDU85_005301 [Gaertneriomyces sp. JEL0708]
MDTPVNHANAFAQAAEEYTERGQWAEAIDAHFRAAEMFMAAVEGTRDKEAVRMLKMLGRDHVRRGGELRRRYGRAGLQPQQRPGVVVTRPTEDALNGYHAPVPREEHRIARQTEGLGLGVNVEQQQLQTHGAGQGELEDLGSRHYFIGQSPTGSSIAHGFPHNGLPVTTETPNDGPAVAPVVSLDESAAQFTQPSESEYWRQEYSVLGEQEEGEGADDDPFNKFWEAVENLVEKISLTGPVAFASAPLRPDMDPASGWSERDAGMAGDHMSETLKSTQMLNSYFVIPPTSGSHTTPGGTPAPGSASQTSQASQLSYGRPVFYGDGMEMESNYFGRSSGNISTSHTSNTSQTLAPSTVQQIPPPHISASLHSMTRSRTASPTQRAYIPPHPRPNDRLADRRSRPSTPSVLQSTKTREELLVENESLKSTIDYLAKRVSMLERAAEENWMLRSSIVQMREGWRRLNANQHPGERHSNVNVSPIVSANNEERNVLEKRVRELEDELKRVKEDSERQTSAMIKYKERWDKLKETAKKKRESASGPSSAVPGSITSTLASLPSEQLPTTATGGAASEPIPIPPLQNSQPQTPRLSLSPPQPSPPGLASALTPPFSASTVVRRMSVPVSRRDSNVSQTSGPVTPAEEYKELIPIPAAVMSTPVGAAGDTTEHGEREPVKRHDDDFKERETDMSQSRRTSGTAASMFYSATSGFGFE